MSGARARAFRAVDEPALAALAADLAPAVRRGGVLHLDGELGAGKTTFARALLKALGVDARIKSPTYSLIESYPAGELAVHHLDLYRIADPGELEWLGLADLTIGPHLIVVEWPERAGSALPFATLWRAPGLLVTPHVGGATPAMWPRAHRLVREQLVRYAAGEPLANVMSGEY